MPEFEEATLRVSYKGAELPAQVLEKLFSSILREIEKTWAQETGKKQSKINCKGQHKTLGQRSPHPGHCTGRKRFEGRWRIVLSPEPTGTSAGVHPCF